MARKGGRGGNKAARSAAAKKGWETRRRGGAKAKPATRKATTPSKPRQAAGRRGAPKTTSARGRALTNQRRAADLVRASRGGKGPSAKAVRSALTAQRARAFYAATGGGKKRSAVKAKSAAKIGKSIRAEGWAKASAARAKVAGRARAGAKVATRRSSGVNGAELTRRFSRLDNGPTDSRGNYTSASPATRRERQLRMETNPAKRTAMQKKLDRAILTETRAKAFRKAVAGVQGLGYGRVSATPQGQATMARNYANRPRFSTRQRIRPTWANGMRP